MSRLLLAALAIAGSGCRSERTKTSEEAPLTIELDCGDGVRTLEVTDLALDEALCDEPWTAWEIAARRTVELVHAQSGRTLRLRRLGTDAIVDVIGSGRVEASYAGVTKIALHEPAPPPVQPMLTVTRGAAVERVSPAQLSKRYPGSRSRAFPICQLLDPAIASQTLTVVGAQGTSSRYTRETCERDGLILHTSNRGDIQLRDRSRQRLVSGVTDIRIGVPDMLGR